MTRTERQKVAVNKWLKNNGKGTIVMPTGVGKTFTAIMAIKALLGKYPSLRILVVVPTLALKDQWNGKVYENQLDFNVEVQVINTVATHNWSCDALVIDEIHRCGSELFSNIFQCVTYKCVLGLTATFDRLDGKEIIIEKYCPVVDTVTLVEARANRWISSYKEYQVLIEVDDIDVYKRFNKEWVEHYEFFQYDFKLAMSLCGKDGWKAKIALRDQMYQGSDENKKKQMLSAINYHSAGFMRMLQQRKAFINNHIKKIEIAKKIMESRPDSKIITFSNNVKMAELLEDGKYVYTAKTSTKKSRTILEDFTHGSLKHIHSCVRLNEGVDIPDASVGIILGTDSSETKARQRRG